MTNPSDDTAQLKDADSRSLQPASDAESGDPTRPTPAEASDVCAAFSIPAADLNTRAMGRKPRPSARARRKAPKEPTHGAT